MTLRWEELLMAGAAAFFVACGGGGGQSPTSPPPPTPTPAPTVILFSPDVSIGERTVALAADQATDESTLFLRLEARQMEDLYGVAFDLLFPEALLQFEGLSEGSFLDADASVETAMEGIVSPPGTLVVGLSRLGQIDGVNGSGSLLTIEFSRLASGSGDLEFESEEAFDSRAEPLAGVEWLAGRVEVPL